MLVERLATGPPLVMALLDLGLSRQPLEDARGLVEQGVDCIQLRAKELRTGELVALAREVLRVTGPAGIPLVVNDRVDVAALTGAAGVHLGADDLSVRSARRILGAGAVLGATVHTEDEVRAASPDADYLGVGAAFASGTKPAAAVWGPRGLTVARALTTLPLIAIGGITPDNVGALRDVGVAGIAAASAVVPVSLHPGAVARFKDVLARW